MKLMKLEGLQVKEISHPATESGLKLKSPPNLRYLEADQVKFIFIFSLSLMSFTNDLFSSNKIFITMALNFL